MQRSHLPRSLFPARYAEHLGGKVPITVVAESPALEQLGEEQCDALRQRGVTVMSMSKYVATHFKDDKQMNSMLVQLQEAAKVASQGL